MSFVIYMSFVTTEFYWIKIENKKVSINVEMAKFLQCSQELLFFFLTSVK